MTTFFYVHPVSLLTSGYFAVVVMYEATQKLGPGQEKFTLINDGGMKGLMTDGRTDQSKEGFWSLNRMYEV